MKKRIKHSLLLLLAVLVVGGCTVSPLVISALQNDHLLDRVKTNLIEPIHIAPKQLSVIEKLGLYCNYGKETSSVTMSSQWRNNTALESRKDVEKAVRAELETLCPKLGYPQILKFFDSMKMDSYSPLTFVDRDEPSRYVILWAIDMKSESANLSLFMDDETHKIYAIGFEAFDEGDADQLLDPVISGRSLKEAAVGFGEYLDLLYEVDFDEYAAYLYLQDKEQTKSISMILEHPNVSYLSISVSYNSYEEEKQIIYN